MPAPGIGQPDALPFLQFQLTNVTATEVGGIAPSVVLPAGASFTLQTDLGVNGLFAGLLVGDVLAVVHHVENIETGTRQSLGGGTITVPNPPTSFSSTAGPFTTADTGGAADLVIPAGFDAGTFRFLTHIHHTAPAKKHIVAAFHDQLIVMVTKP